MFDIVHFFLSIGEMAMPAALFLADYGVIWIPLVCVLTVIPRTRKTGIMAVVGLILDVILCDGLKHLSVQNPYTEVWMVMNRFRLPSGAAAAAFTTLTALCFSREGNFWKAALAVACVIAFSGNHALNPTDIVGGMAIGSVFGYVGCKIVELLERTIKKEKYSHTA